MLMEAKARTKQKRRVVCSDGTGKETSEGEIKEDGAEEENEEENLDGVNVETNED